MVRRNRTVDRSVALFVLGAILLLPPLLLVFNRPERFAGIPILYLYVFVVWCALIAIAAAVAHSIPYEEMDSSAAGPAPVPASATPVHPAAEGGRDA
jgi:Ca2+/Na+ antiporter